MSIIVQDTVIVQEQNENPTVDPFTVQENNENIVVAQDTATVQKNNENPPQTQPIQQAQQPQEVSLRRSNKKKGENLSIVSNKLSVNGITSSSSHYLMVLR